MASFENHTILLGIFQAVTKFGTQAGWQGYCICLLKSYWLYLILHIFLFHK